MTNKYLELSNCYLRTNEPAKAWKALEESKLYIGNELTPVDFFMLTTSLFVLFTPILVNF